MVTRCRATLAPTKVCLRCCSSMCCNRSDCCCKYVHAIICAFDMQDMFAFCETRVCAVVTQCAKNNGGCDKKRKCIITKSIRTCGDCPSGWENNGPTGCKGLLGCLVDWSSFQHFHFAWIGYTSRLVLFTGKRIHVYLYAYM